MDTFNVASLFRVNIGGTSAVTAGELQTARHLTNVQKYEPLIPDLETFTTQETAFVSRYEIEILPRRLERKEQEKERRDKHSEI